MNFVHDGLAKEFEFVTREGERIHIGEQFDSGDELMQSLAYGLITGNHEECDKLTKQALDDGYAPNTILDDGLIADTVHDAGPAFEAVVLEPADEAPEGLHDAELADVGRFHAKPFVALQAADGPDLVKQRDGLETAPGP